MGHSVLPPIPTADSPPQIPEFSWRPDRSLHWWLAPRSTDLPSVLWERAVRFLFFLLPIMGISLLAGSIEGNLSPYPLISFTMIATYILFGGASLYYLHRQHIGLAGLFMLLTLVRSVFASLFNEGYGYEIHLVTVMINVMAAALLLRSQYIIPAALSITTGYTVIGGLAWEAGYIPLVSEDGVIGFGIGLTIVSLIIATMLTFMRGLLENYFDQSLQLIAELELRVKERTAELEKARDQALEADRVKSQFLANMNHELRTPLNAVLNFTAFVADGVLGPVNEEQKKALRQSIDSGDHLLSLINDVLDITKIESGMMDLFIQPVKMNEILEVTLATGRGLVKEKPLEIIEDIQPDLPLTYGDKRRLRQVMLNMLSNAVKFTEQGTITVKASSDGEQLHISVADTGIGISPEEQALVFESFRQAQHNFHEATGTGLGMPISKYFVESHGGRMWLESTPGQGTAFFVELPILTEDQAKAFKPDKP